MCKQAKQDDVDRIYDPEIRKFAINLHFYSSKSYEYVRNVFHEALPAVGALRTWTSHGLYVIFYIFASILFHLSNKGYGFSVFRVWQLLVGEIMVNWSGD